MNGKVRISARQFLILVTLFVVGDPILYVPSMLTDEAGQNAWLVAIIVACAGMLLVVLYNALGFHFPRSTITQYPSLILGDSAGRVVAFLYISFFFTDAAVLVWQIGDFMTTQIMPETPDNAFLLLFSVLIVMGARLGLEVIARTAEILFPWFILLITMTFLFLLPQWDKINLQPLIANVETNGMVSGGLKFFGYLLESVILLMIFPHVDRIKLAGKKFLTGMLLGNITFILIISFSIAVLGAEIVPLFNYPSYTLVQKISLGRFLERFEAVMALMWFITLFMKATICFYATVKGLKHTCRLKDHRPLTIPLGIILIIYADVSNPNRLYYDAYEAVWVPYMITLGLVLPAFFLCMAVVRKKAGKVKHQVR